MITYVDFRNKNVYESLQKAFNMAEVLEAESGTATPSKPGAAYKRKKATKYMSEEHEHRQKMFHQRKNADYMRSNLMKAAKNLLKGTK